MRPQAVPGSAGHPETSCAGAQATGRAWPRTPCPVTAEALNCLALDSLPPTPSTVPACLPEDEGLEGQRPTLPVQPQVQGQGNSQTRLRRRSTPPPPPGKGLGRGSARGPGGRAAPPLGKSPEIDRPIDQSHRIVWAGPRGQWGGTQRGKQPERHRAAPSIQFHWPVSSPGLGSA